MPRFEQLDRMKAGAAARDPRRQSTASQDSRDLIGPEGQMLVGTPEYVAERLIAEQRALGQELHLLQVDNGLSPEESARLGDPQSVRQAIDFSTWPPTVAVDESA